MKNFLRIVIFVIIVSVVYYTTMYLINQNDEYVKIENHEMQNEEVNLPEETDFIFESGEKLVYEEIINNDNLSGDIDTMTESGEINEDLTAIGDMTNEPSGDLNSISKEIHEEQQIGDNSGELINN